jgi:hypothetical protein
MGTRNLIAVQLDGEYRVAQYGQWDGYPSGQGAEVLEFLSNWDRPLFEKKLRAVNFYTPDELAAIWREAGADEAGYINYDAAQRQHRRTPEISRDAGADILKMVQDRPEGIALKNSIDFAGDSLMCEYAYVIDLDANVLEVFKGFNNEPLPEGARFTNAPRRGDEYYPVRLAASYPLGALPTVEKMVADVDPPDAEEEAA